MTSIINEKKDEDDDDDRHKKNIENGIAPSISDIGKKTPSPPATIGLPPPYLIAHSFSILFFLYLLPLLPVSIATVIGILADFGRKSSEKERQR